jgi:lauroyl/myristoyl acyltransferase
MLERARDRVVDLGYAAGWGLVKSAPSGLSRRAFAAVADAASAHNGAGTQQLRKNLRRVVGPGYPEVELDHLVGESLRSYARYWLETFRLPKMDHDEVIATVDKNIRGIEHVDAARELDLGAIMVLPHMGNWDACGLWFVHRDGPFTTVAERLKPESLYDRFVEYRESLGFEVLPLTGGARPPLDVLKERLRANRNVCLVSDRDLSRTGIEVQFFGEATRMPGGPAVLAATTGAPLITAFPYFTEDGWAVDFDAPLEIPAGGLRHQVTGLTQAMADNFARGIAEHPADWHMLQRLWLADLPPRDPKPTAKTG